MCKWTDKKIIDLLHAQYMLIQSDKFKKFWAVYRQSEINQFGYATLHSDRYLVLDAEEIWHARYSIRLDFICMRCTFHS